MLNTIERVKELANERNLTLCRLALLCNVPHSTIKTTERRGGQLSLDTIERICGGLGISLSEFFAVKEP